MGTGFAKKKKQAKLFQEQFSKIQDQMKTTEVEGQAGGGLVTIKLSGENQLLSIKIKPECVDPTDVEGLEDLIKIAHDNAFNKLKSQFPEMDNIGSGGLSGLKLPF
jgi:nucleoid-associated protein EbfC